MLLLIHFRYISYYDNWTCEIIAIQCASLAGGDHVKSFFNRTLHCTLFRPNLRTMFEFKGETDNIVKFSCLLCLPKKNVSAFINSRSTIRQHVEVRTGSYRGSRGYRPTGYLTFRCLPEPHFSSKKKQYRCLDHIHQAVNLCRIENLQPQVFFVNGHNPIFPGNIPFYPTVGLNGILSQGKRDVNFAELRQRQ